MRIPPALRTACWFAYPFVALLVLAGLLYYSALTLDSSGPEPEPELLNRGIDLQAPDARQRVITGHNEATSGGGAGLKLGDAKSVNRIVHTGMIQTQTQRHLFEVIVMPLQTTTVLMVSENQHFQYRVGERLRQETDPETLQEHPRLALIADTLAELASGMIDPLHAAALFPDHYPIESLRKVQQGHTQAIAVDIVCKIRPSGRATVYLDERNMRPLSAETNLMSESTRKYRFRYSDRSDAESQLFPTEVAIELGDGSEWTVYLSRSQVSFETAGLY